MNRIPRPHPALMRCYAANADLLTVFHAKLNRTGDWWGIMARPPLVLGTWGTIKRRETAAGWVAYARFRDYDGVTRQVERKGETGARAESNLKRALRDRSKLPSEDIIPETRLTRVLDDWDALLDSRDLSDGTRTQYRQQLRHLRKGMGSLQLREVTVPAVDRFLTAISVSSGPETARLCRVVLAGACQYAVRKGAMSSNPVRDAEPVKRERKPVETFDVQGVLVARASMRAWDAGKDKRGVPRMSDLADPTDMIIATGARTGEVFAIRWDDLDLDGPEPRVLISGTVTVVDGKLHRQSHPKTHESYRELILPGFAVGMLRVRERVSEFVFPSSTGTMRSPNNFRRQWRDWRSASKYESWVTPKTFRKAVATLLAVELGDDAAGNQLGHAKGSTVTRKHYIKRARLAPDVRQVLDMFASVYPAVMPVKAP